MTYSSDRPTESNFELLQERLDEITATTRALVPADRLALVEAWIAELFATGIEERMMKLGELAPGFTLPDAVTGKVVRSNDLLGLGCVILKFFRGRWDPYDVTELETWQALHGEVRQRNALLVAISPQLPRQNDFTASQHRLSFPLLSDSGCVLAERFRVAYALPEAMQRYYRSIMVNVPFVNGDSTWRLPLPATIVLAPDGRVLFAEAHADHRVRPEPTDALAALDRFAARG